jgi:hypothetical protein
LPASPLGPNGLIGLPSENGRERINKNSVICQNNNW